MNLIEYTKQYSEYRDYLSRQLHRKYEKKIDKTDLKRDKYNTTGEYHENAALTSGPLGKLYHNLKAKRNFRKASLMSNRINFYKKAASRLDGDKDKDVPSNEE